MFLYKMIAALMWMFMLTNGQAFEDVPGNPELYLHPETIEQVVSWPPPIEDNLKTNTRWGENLHLFNLMKNLQHEIYDENPIENIEDQNNERDWSMSPGLKGLVQKKWLSKFAHLPAKTTQPQNQKYMS